MHAPFKKELFEICLHFHVEGLAVLPYGDHVEAGTLLPLCRRAFSIAVGQVLDLAGSVEDAVEKGFENVLALGAPKDVLEKPIVELV